MHRVLNQLAILLCAGILLAAPASAQRDLPIDKDKAWTHPHSQIVVPPSLAGLPLDRATEFAPDFLNLGFSFRGEDGSDELSLYIYRNTNGGVPVWFEQGRLGIEGRDIYANPQLANGVEQYGWPGNAAWQGQRVLYATPNSTYSTSTGLALFSINGWFVKVRATSDNRSAVELGEWIDAALMEVATPVSDHNQPPAISVTDCEEKLSFKKRAKDAKRDGASSILGAVLGGMIADKAKERQASDTPVVAWCRDSALSAMQVAYRANASADSYLIALGDSGMGVSVAPDVAAGLLDDEPKKSKNYAITVITDSQRINFVPQNRLPSLKRVLEVINANRRVSAVSTWGEDSTIELNSDAL